MAKDKSGRRASARTFDSGPIQLMSLNSHEEIGRKSREKASLSSKLPAIALSR